MVASSEEGLKNYGETRRNFWRIWHDDKCKKDKDNGDFQEQSHTDDNQSTEMELEQDRISLLRKYSHWKWTMFKRNSEANCNGKGSTQQKRRTAQRKALERPQETNGESFSLEHSFICVRDVDHQKWWHQRTGSIWDADLAEDRKDQLTKHITNDQVLTMVREQRSPMDTIRERQRNWISHILRGNLLPITVLKGKIGSLEGRRTRGKPKMKMLNGIMTEGHTKLS